MIIRQGTEEAKKIVAINLKGERVGGIIEFNTKTKMGKFYVFFNEFHVLKYPFNKNPKGKENKIMTSQGSLPCISIFDRETGKEII